MDVGLSGPGLGQELLLLLPGKSGELRLGLLVVMPDAMGLLPRFMGLLVLATGFPRSWLWDVLVPPQTTVTIEREPGDWLVFCCQGAES